MRKLLRRRGSSPSRATTAYAPGSATITRSRFLRRLAGDVFVTARRRDLLDDPRRLREQFG